MKRISPLGDFSFFESINPLMLTQMNITVKVKQLLQHVLCLGIMICSVQFLSAQVFGRLVSKAPMYQDISSNAMYSLSSDPNHRSRIDVVNLYSGTYNIQVLCQWKDMYRAKDMGTDRTFLIRRGDIVQLGSNLSQMSQTRYNVSTASYYTQGVSTNVPQCVDTRYRPSFPNVSNPVANPISRGQTVANPRTTSRIHEVRPKETLYRIGLKYGIPYQELMAVNGMNSTELFVGQRLRIERSSMSVPSAVARQPIYRSPEPLPVQAPITLSPTQRPTLVRVNNLNSPAVVGTSQPDLHIVRKGETLSSIGRIYGLSTKDLVYFNGIKNPNKVRVGQVLKLGRFDYR